MSDNNLYKKEIRFFSSILCLLSFIPSIAHLFFNNTPEGVSFGGFYDIYNFIALVGIQITTVMFAAGILLGSYRICAVPTLLLGLFNLTEYALRFLLWDSKWTWFCFIVICLVLGYAIRIIKKSEILLDKKALEIQGEIKEIKKNTNLKLESLDKEEEEIIAKLKLT